MTKAVTKAVSKATSAVVGASALYLGSALTMPIIVKAKDKKVWQKIDLPTKDTIFDINFDPKKPEHGWLIGAKGTFLETFDAGVTWKPRTFNSLDEDEDITYRFEMASLLNDEGWIIGKPAIMLHTRDGGKQFERIPLSPKLPGDPVAIKATGLLFGYIQVYVKYPLKGSTGTDGYDIYFGILSLSIFISFEIITM
jgi:photosystem II stability/assembly factor-like uncharacterized protein